MGSRSEFIDHTAELAFRIEADTWPALVAEAVRALGAELAAEGGRHGPAPARTIVLEAADREALLVDLLNELIFLAETERWAPAAATAVDATDRVVRLRCDGIALAAPPSRIKAATFHGLSVRNAGGRTSAEVILDV